MEDDEQYDIALNSMDTSVPDTPYFVKFSPSQQVSGWLSQFQWSAPSEITTFRSAEPDYSSLLFLCDYSDDEADDDNESVFSMAPTVILQWG